MGYTFGGPELLRNRPQTIAGEKDLAALYLPLETTMRVLLRVPESVSGGKTGDVDPAVFEETTRKACAAALVGVEAQGFVVDVAAILEFEPGGA